MTESALVPVRRSDPASLRRGIVPGVSRRLESEADPNVLQATWAGGQALVAWLAERGVPLTSEAIDRASFTIAGQSFQVAGAVSIRAGLLLVAQQAVLFGAERVGEMFGVGRPEFDDWVVTDEDWDVIARAFDDAMAAVPFATLPVVSDPVAEFVATILMDRAASHSWSPEDTDPWFRESGLAQIEDAAQWIPSAQALARDRRVVVRRESQVPGR